MSIFDDHPANAASGPAVPDAVVPQSAAVQSVPASSVPTPSAPTQHPLALTEQMFRDVLPEKMKKSLNQQLIDQINKTLSNPGEFESFRDNLLSYTKVMQDGKFKIENYVEAVKYVSHKLMGCSNIEAYMKTFPDKYQGFVQAGVAAKDIASYVTAYNKGKLVNLIYEQTLIPVHVLNMDLYQRALNVQCDLMMNAQSEKVRCEAANSVLVQLRPPEVKKVELDIGVKENDAISALKQQSLELAESMRQAIAAGAITAEGAAGQRLVVDMGDAEVVR